MAPTTTPPLDAGPSDPNTLETRLSGRPLRRAHIRSLVRTLFAALLAALLAASGIQAAAGEVVIGGQITGTVTDPEGRPASGVDVHLAWLEEDGTTHVTKYAQSDAAGAYRFADVEAGRYTLQFRPTGPFAWEWWGGKVDARSAVEFDVADGDAVSGMDVQLSPGASLEGVIRGDGSADVLFTDVHLYVVADDGALVYVRRESADADGRFRFERLFGGTYTFQVSPERTTTYAEEWWDDQPRRESADRIDVPTGGAVSGLEVQLDPGASISGTLRNEAGEPLAGQDVALYEVGGDGDRRVGTVSSDSSTGRFEFTRVPRGDYAVRSLVSESSWYADEWWKDAADRAAAQVIHVGKDEVVTGLDMALPLRTSLSGQVRGAAGEAVSRARVELHSLVDGEPVLQTWMETDAAGSFAFMGLETGRYTVRVDAPSASKYVGQWWNGQVGPGSADPIELDGLEQGRIDVVLATGAAISGRVTDGDAEPVAAVRVYAYTADGGARTVAGEGRTSADGAYEFIGLEAGSYALCFSPPDEANLLHECWNDQPDKAAADLIAVALGETATGRDATLARGGSIVGEVIGIDGKPLLDVMVQSYRQDASGLFRPSGYDYTDASGQYSILGLASGSYVVQFRPPRASPYVREWWDDQADSAVSDRIQVVAGEAHSGVDATLTRIVALSTPSLLGTATVGSTLTASSTTTDAAAELTYAWFADERELAGETGPTLHLTEDHLGTRIHLRVTASLSGYVTVTRESAQTQPIAAIPPVDLAAPQVSGTAGVGSTLKATATSSTPGAALAFQWLADGNEMIDETGSTLILGADALGRGISVRVTASAQGHSPVMRESSATEPVTAGTLDAAVPTISGSARTGSTLTATPGPWTGGTSFTYQWFASGTPITGETDAVLTLGQAHAGKQISVRVTGSKAGYTTLSRTSAATAKVFLVATPAISGTPAVGAKLTAKPGTWATGATLRYQWYASGTAISGATASTFAPASGQAGRQITVRVTGALAGYPTTALTSTPTLKVATVGSPTVSGAAVTGSTLTAKAGTWTTGTTFAYQWYASGVAISGATSATFVPTSAQAGKQIAVRVTGTLAGYPKIAKTSPVTGKVYLAPAPSISGTPAIGSTVSVARGTWTSGSTFTYQWYANGSAISGATATSLKLTSGLAGKQVSVRVTGRLTGYPTTSRYSPPTPRVIVTATPTVSGTPSVGGTLTANPGTWTAGTTFGYQWYADGTAISGATARTFVPTASHTGKQFSVRVTGRLEGYATVSRWSAATSRVALAGTPAIVGTVAVGQTLTAKPGTWTSGTALTYQWYASGSPISGATSSTLKLTSSHAGKPVTVRVTGRLSGYPTLSRDATPTARVMTAGTPTVIGTPAVGAALTAAPGTWTTGTAFTYAWYADGVAVEGATANTFTPGDGEVGTQVSVRVTGVLTGYATVSTTSARTAVVESAPPAP